MLLIIGGISMNEKGLIEQVLRIINANYSNIYVIDVIDDKVYGFSFAVANNLVINKVMSYTNDFINLAYKFVHEEDIGAYFNALNINKLEEEKTKGNQETKVKYRKLCETGEYRYCVNIINYLSFEGKKLIFMMSEDINERLVEEEVKTNQLETEVISYKNRLTSETESMANALYQVNNILENSSSSDVLKMKDTRAYINQVFSNASLSHPELNKALQQKLNESANYSKPCILIVDDSSIIRNSLKRIFQNDYEILMAKNGNEAINIITENVINSSYTGKNKNIVGILLDLVMPMSDGFVVLDFMKNFNLFNKIPVAIISGDETKETRKKVYEYEIVDMLEKPFNTETIRKRLGKIINLYMTSSNLQNIVAIQDEKLQDNTLDETSENLKLVVNQIVSNILRNPESNKLRKLAKIITTNFANKYPIYGINQKMIDAIVNTIALYNIGSIAMADNEVITANTIKQEIDYGLTIIDSCIVDPEEKRVAENIIKYSFEMYNGNGYPNGLSGNDIPIEAQITNLLVRIIKNDRTKSIITAIKLVIEHDANKYNQDLIEVLNESKKEVKNNV